MGLGLGIESIIIIIQFSGLGIGYSMYNYTVRWVDSGTPLGFGYVIYKQVDVFILG